MQADDLLVTSQLQIELDEGRTLLRRQLEGGDRVLRRVRRRAAVSDDGAGVGVGEEQGRLGWEVRLSALGGTGEGLGTGSVYRWKAMLLTQRPRAESRC